MSQGRWTAWLKANTRIHRPLAKTASWLRDPDWETPTVCVSVCLLFFIPMSVDACMCVCVCVFWMLITWRKNKLFPTMWLTPLFNLASPPFLFFPPPAEWKSKWAQVVITVMNDFAVPFHPCNILFLKPLSPLPVPLEVGWLLRSLCFW